MDNLDRHTLFDAYVKGQLTEQERIDFEQELKKDEVLNSEFKLYSLVIGGIEQQAENESALQVANRQDRINEANREAIALYMQAATNYP